jgi:hypothetical protein
MAPPNGTLVTTARGTTNKLRYERVIRDGGEWQQCVALALMSELLSWVQETADRSPIHPIATAQRGGNDEETVVGERSCTAFFTGRGTELRIELADLPLSRPSARCLACSTSGRGVSLDHQKQVYGSGELCSNTGWSASGVLPLTRAALKPQLCAPRSGGRDSFPVSPPPGGDFLVSNFHPGAIPGNLVRNDFWC